MDEPTRSPIDPAHRSDDATDREPVAPDVVLGPGGAPLEPFRLRDAVLALPQLARLLVRLLRDPRVPFRSKAAIGAVVVYMVTPLDILPDVAPVIGQTDDLLLVALALDHLLRHAGEEVILEHWDGRQDVLEMVRQILDFGAGLVPRRARWMVRRLLGD